MSLVRLLGFTTLACGCVIGKYREVATSREIAYVEEKGRSCASHAIGATTRSRPTEASSAPSIALACAGLLADPSAADGV